MAHCEQCGKSTRGQRRTDLKGLLVCTANHPLWLKGNPQPNGETGGTCEDISDTQGQRDHIHSARGQRPDSPLPDDIVPGSSSTPASLGEWVPLTVGNLAFCRAVQSFGSIKEFKRNEFAPDQEVLLYAEVENHSSEETPKGFHTALRSNYQIFDSQGRQVDGHEFATTTEDYCRGPRRDFFIGYHLRMPKRAYDGEHTLQLTIEDLKAKKIGQSSITFTIKARDGK